MLTPSKKICDCENYQKHLICENHVAQITWNPLTTLVHVLVFFHPCNSHHAHGLFTWPWAAIPIMGDEAPS